MCCDKVGVVYRRWPYLGKYLHNGKNRSHKQKRNDSPSFLQSQKPSSAMKKLMRTSTGKEDPELPLLQRISSLELSASEIAAQINASQSSSNRHISTSTVRRKKRESGLHGRIAIKKPLLKVTNKKKRLAWAKNHQRWT